jgi:hypothetical protein
MTDTHAETAADAATAADRAPADGMLERFASKGVMAQTEVDAILAQHHRKAAIGHLRQGGFHRLANEIESGCLNLPANAPFFVLAPQDPTAATAVRQWVLDNGNVQPALKLANAKRIADEMDFYPKKIG